LFVGVNINDDIEQWNTALEETHLLTNNVRHYQTTSFEELSKKLVLSNLNKIIHTNSEKEITDGFLNIAQLQTYLTQ
jgi:hypothetical protein